MVLQVVVFVVLTFDVVVAWDFVAGHVAASKSEDDLLKKLLLMALQEESSLKYEMCPVSKTAPGFQQMSSKSLQQLFVFEVKR